MKLRFLQEFNQAVLNRFGAMAESLDLKLKQLADGVFEIASQLYSLRIRLGTGHRVDFLVTLVDNKEKADDANALTGEIGLGVIMEYYGTKLIESRQAAPQDIDAEIARMADLSQHYCVPFLSGKSADWVSIKEFVQTKIEKAGGNMKKYNFPKNVREEWEV
jgi:hypothetical protein